MEMLMDALSVLRGISWLMFPLSLVMVVTAAAGWERATLGLFVPLYACLLGWVAG